MHNMTYLALPTVTTCKTVSKQPGSVYLNLCFYYTWQLRQIRERMTMLNDMRELRGPNVPTGLWLPRRADTGAAEKATMPLSTIRGR